MKTNTNLLNCLIVDDKMLAIELLENFAKRSGKFNTILKTTHPEKALEILKQEQIDMLFLDIHMPQMTGIDLVRSLATKPAIIFTTAYAEHAVTAFDLDATDYLTKPIPYERFLKSVNKSIQQFKNKKQENDFISVKSDGHIHKINLNDIIHIEGKKDYVKFHCLQSTHTSLQNMTQLEDKLKQHSFIRIHKSHIISISKIKSYSTDEIIMSNGEPIPISRSKKNEVLNYLTSEINT